MHIRRNVLPVIVGLVAVSNAAAWGRSGKDAVASLQTASSAVTADANDAKNKHLAVAVIQVEINAPQQYVWHVLTDFTHYPETFKRIESCRVTKRDADLVFTETYLKPHMFLNEPCQHAINNLSGAPSTLTWKATDGNFKALGGKWELKPEGTGDKCLATYTLQVDAGGVIPSPLVGIALKNMQKEIVSSLKKTVESTYPDSRVSVSPVAAPPTKRSG